MGGLVFRGRYIDTVGTFMLMERASKPAAAAPGDKTAAAGADADAKADAEEGSYRYAGQSVKRCCFTLDDVGDA